ncbi:MAG TPA: mechanosensitive ion channel domain-containing protein [Acetobacteraceae bacterium]|nr:mechanosensitive ion channel domain-containing protein [Acetobacteraceae bacterium]
MPLRYRGVQALIPIDWQNVLQDSIDWLHRYVLVPAFLAQIVCVIVLLLIMRIVAPLLERAVLSLARPLPAGPLHLLTLVLSRVAQWIVLLLLLWFARVAFNDTGHRADVLRLAESLALVWVLIRVSSMLVRDERLARAVAILAWVIAALNIAGMIGPVVGLLDAMAVPIGNFRLSLLLVLKGGVTLAIFVWIANAVSRLAEQRLRVFTPLTPAVQVLASKLVRMTLLTLAVVLALGSIGIDLTAFAVFSGAIGVGVGFGLQKVVSNLVSGVILLMDRSIKPGDVIEIDNTYGSVIALNARYASVQTRDGKEFLIPNEDLITQRVTNWSFSSDLIRQHVRVGISYQADPHQAIALALEAARDVPRVLHEPVPNCLLVEFGDSTINLDLRFWIKDPVNGTANVRSEVMLKLWDLFQQNGIEIPWPQRELTLRNPEALAHALNAQVRGLHKA